MSFGKNSDDLAKINPYNSGSFNRRRQQWYQAKESQRSHKGGGGGGASLYSDRFKPRTTAYDLVRIIPGAYECEIGIREGASSYVEKMVLEYYPFVEHYHARLKRGAICSGGPLYFDRNKREPCVGCEKFYELMETDEATGKKKRGAMGMRDMVALSIIHLAPHHKTPSIDRDTGKPRINEKTGEPYYDWVECMGGRTCVMCKNGDETVAARRKHWPMGLSHFNVLADETAAKIAQSCGSCGKRSSIRTVAWLCGARDENGKPSCGEAIIDMENTSLSDEEIAKIVEQETKCPRCGVSSYLEEVLECDGCSKARRATLFDADIEVKRFATGTGDTTILVVGDYFIRPIDPALQSLAEPLDLPRLYAPTPLEEQVRRFEREEKAVRSGAVPYSRSR